MIEPVTGTVVVAAVSGLGGWLLQAWRQRSEDAKEMRGMDVTVEKHRDELTFQLLGSARDELTAAKTEVAQMRDEIRGLRSLEEHFYHFQQALDHLEAVLQACTPEARAVAEGNATAFLTRMRKLKAAAIPRNEKAT